MRSRCWMTERTLLWAFVSQLQNIFYPLSISWTERGMSKLLSQPRFTKACCFSETFRIWSPLNIRDFSFSFCIFLYPDMKAKRDCYLHFYAWVYFSSGNRNVSSSAESQSCWVLECLRLPFHLHISQTALCFPLTTPLANFLYLFCFCTFFSHSPWFMLFSNL